MNEEENYDHGEDLLLGGAKKLVVVSLLRRKISQTIRLHGFGKYHDVDADGLTLQLPGASSHAASFQIEKEDHTLGNALRYFVTKK